MRGSMWDLSEAGDPCDSYQPGHRVFYVHFNVSMRIPSPVIPVTAVVDDDGLVHIEGDDLSVVRWNHRPEVLRAALQRFGGRADWKPRWHLLAVPMELFIGSARSVFNMADPAQRTPCPVGRRVNRDGPSAERTAAQQRNNAARGKTDNRHVPPLRLADRYRDGRPKPRSNGPAS